MFLKKWDFFNFCFFYFLSSLSRIRQELSCTLLMIWSCYDAKRFLLIWFFSEKSDIECRRPDSWYIDLLLSILHLLRFWQSSKSQKVISKTHNTLSTRCSHSFEQTGNIFSQLNCESQIYDFAKITEVKIYGQKWVLWRVILRDFVRVISRGLEKLYPCIFSRLY